MKDRVSSILKKFKEVKLSPTDILKIQQRINSEMKISRIKHYKRMKKSIESISKIVINKQKPQ